MLRVNAQQLPLLIVALTLSASGFLKLASPSATSAVISAELQAQPFGGKALSLLLGFVELITGVLLLSKPTRYLAVVFVFVLLGAFTTF